MLKRVVLLTGTPCVGKTSVAKQLAVRLDALNVNLTELAVRGKLVAGTDEERHSAIVDESRMKKRISKIIEGSDKKNIIVDGHYAASVVPARLVSRVFVLRRSSRTAGAHETTRFFGAKSLRELGLGDSGRMLGGSAKRSWRKESLRSRCFRQERRTNRQQTS